LPAPIGEEVKIRKTEGSIVAVKKFSGKPTEEVVKSKEKDLRSALIKDGLKPEKGCLLARYNDPRTSAFVMVLFFSF
jgi:SOUL heme-binding protein